MAFTVGGVAADVEPDFSETRAKTERGLERVERGLELQVTVVPNVTKSFASKLKADLRRQAGTIAIPVTPTVSKSAGAQVARQIKADLKASAKRIEIPVTPVVSKSAIGGIGRQIRNELKASARKIEVPITATVNKSSAAGIRRQLKELHVSVPLDFNVTASSMQNIKAAEKELPNIRLTAELNLQQSHREIAKSMKLLEKELPKLTLNVDISTADLASGATRKMVAFNGLAKKESAKAGRDAGDSFTDGMRSKLAKAGPKLNSAVKSSLSGVGSAAASVGKTAAKGLAVGVAAAGAGFGVAVKKASDFQSQLSELQVISGASGKQMNELSDAALKAGADTVFSAKESAKAQAELAKAGVSTNDILKGGLTGTLSLAAAGGLELADAATVTANALNAFGLTGDKTSHVADLLAAAANKSAADVSDLAPALQQSALVASQMGLSLETTTGTLAAFAQAGLKGSDAGTSFKTFLQRLTPQSKEAADMMSKLGLSFYDANGAFIGMPKVADQLQGALKGLNEEQRNQAFQTLFGADAVRAAAIVYNEGGAGVNNWTKAVNDAGYASDVAKGKLDNLSGDLENLKGSFETVFIKAGSDASTGLRGIVQAATSAVNAAGPSLQKIIDPISRLIADLFPKIVPLLEPIADILGSVIDAFGPALGPLSDALGTALGGIAEAFKTLGPVIGDSFKTLQPVFDLLGKFVATGAGALGNLAEAILPPLAESFAAIAKAVTPVVDALGPLIADIAPQLGEAFGRLVEALAPLMPVLGDALIEIIEALLPLIPNLVDVFVDLIELAVIPLIPLIPPLVKAFAWLAKIVTSKPFLIALVGIKIALAALAAVAAANPITLIVGAVVALGAAVVIAYKKFKPFRDVVDSIGRFFRDTLWPGIKNVAAAIGGALKKAFDVAWPVIQKVWDLFKALNLDPIIKGVQALFKLFTGDFSGAADTFGSIFSGITDAASGLIDMVWPMLQQFGDWIVTTAVPWLAEQAVALGGAFLGWIADAIPTALMKLGELLVALGSWVVGTAIPWLIEKGVSLTTTFLGWIVDAAVGLPLKLAEWLVSFGAWIIGTAIPWLFEKGTALAGAFVQWVADLVVSFPGKMWGWLTAFGSWIVDTAIPWLTEKAAGIGSAVVSWIGDTVASLPGRLAGIADAVLGFLGSLPGRLASAASSVGSAIWNGIVDGLSGAAGAIGDIASSIWDGLKGFINEHFIQPIRDFEVLGGHPFGSFPMLAEGALITKPTVAVVGEAGPELVLPLSDPKRMDALLREATGQGLLPSAAPVTATAAPQAAAVVQAAVTPTAQAAAPTQAATAAPTAATGPSLTTEAVQAWATEITTIMVALPTQVTEQTMPLWTDWVAQMDALMFGWSTRFVAMETTTWATAEATQAGALGRMNTGLSTAINQMVTTASTGAQRIGAALNNGLNAAINTAVLKVQDYGTKLAAAINPVLAAIGQPPVVLHFAEGGAVPGPRVKADVVPAMLMPGEFVVKRDVVDRVGVDKLHALNQGKVQHFADGGAVLPADAINRAQTFARAQAGEPYVWGSSGPDGFDCSGFWSAIINTIREPDTNPYRRIFNTASLIDGGWQNVGMLPGTGQVSVGAFKGNPGHMAGTIAGLNAESRGSAGVVVGPSARGATDRLFTNQYHLGNGLYLGGTGSLYPIPEPYKLGNGFINHTGEKYMQYVHGKTKPWVDANTYTSNITAGMVVPEPGVGLTSGWLPATSGKISEFGGPGDINSLAVSGGTTANPPMGPYWSAMRWQTRNYSALKNNRLKATLARTGRSVVMYPGDWGPAQWTGRVLDISPAAMQALGGRTDDVVSISAVPNSTTPGPVPVLHDGGQYTNPWHGEGLALLEHREHVLPANDPVRAAQVYRSAYGEPQQDATVATLGRIADKLETSGNTGDTVTVNVTAPSTTDPTHFGKIVGLRVKNARR